MIPTQNKSRASTTWILLILVILLAAAGLMLHPGSEFGGADGAAEEAIGEIVPDYEPWVKNIWQPPGAETESLLFALQAALGAGFVGYYLGLKRGEKKAAKEQVRDTLPTASSVD